MRWRRGRRGGSSALVAVAIAAASLLLGACTVERQYRVAPSIPPSACLLRCQRAVDEEARETCLLRCPETHRGSCAKPYRPPLGACFTVDEPSAKPVLRGVAMVGALMMFTAIFGAWAEGGVPSI